MLQLLRKLQGGSENRKNQFKHLLTTNPIRMYISIFLLATYLHHAFFQLKIEYVPQEIGFKWMHNSGL